ncbi:MAG TPA: hypothetical protein DD713_03400 [Nitrospiraceae bacterium]|nr:hypothetical protein [Nitrospiraceae bacterium]
MRRGLILNERDFQIFKHLAPGPATEGNIFRHFFDNGNGNTRTRKRIMLRRLKKLEKAKLIKSRYNPRVRNTIYVLDKHGAEYAADKFGLELSNIRCFFPRHADIFHDLMVSAVTKIAERDINEYIKFEYLSLYTETYIKKEHAGKKGIFYPDLRIRITNSEGSMNFDLEVDCGTISKAAFIGKIRTFQGIILIVVRTDARMKLLQRYLREIGPNKIVLITFIDNITADGFLHCKWLTPNGNVVTIMEKFRS